MTVTLQIYILSL